MRKIARGLVLLCIIATVVSCSSDGGSAENQRQITINGTTHDIIDVVILTFDDERSVYIKFDSSSFVELFFEGISNEIPAGNWSVIDGTIFTTILHPTTSGTYWLDSTSGTVVDIVISGTDDGIVSLEGTISDDTVPVGANTGFECSFSYSGTYSEFMY